MNEEIIQSLTELGFTPMEAQVYIALLADSPQSGYGLAKKLGKPAAYIYRAVDALEKKGALLKQQGETKLLRATPYDEFIHQLEEGFRARLTRAEKNLKSIRSEGWDDHIYALSTVEQVYERAKGMLLRANDLVSVYIYPAPYEQLRDELETVSARGVFVGMVTYEAIQTKVNACVQATASSRVPNWPRQWLRIAVDGTEFMSALFSGDGSGIYDAVWSANPVQAWLALYSMEKERRLHMLLSHDPEDPDMTEVRELMREWRDPKRVRTPKSIKRFEEYFGWSSGMQDNR